MFEKKQKINNEWVHFLLKVDSKPNIQDELER